MASSFNILQWQGDPHTKSFQPRTRSQLVNTGALYAVFATGEWLGGLYVDGQSKRMDDRSDDSVGKWYAQFEVLYVEWGQQSRVGQEMGIGEVWLSRRHTSWVVGLDQEREGQDRAKRGRQ